MTTHNSEVLTLLTTMLDEELSQQPELVRNYDRVFQGDDVAEQWIDSAVQADIPAASSSQPDESEVQVRRFVKVLLTEEDVLEELPGLVEEVCAAVVQQFDPGELAENVDDAAEKIGEAVAGEIKRMLDELVPEANELFRTEHAVQGAE